MAAHPTHYRFREDVRDLMLKYLNHKELQGLISVNTYFDHPPGFGLDHVSADIWGRGGRGSALGDALRRRAFDIVFRDPSPPRIRWIISGGGMWTPGAGWQRAPWGPVGSDAGHWHHIHITFW